MHAILASGMKIGIDARLWNESGVGRYTRNLIQELLQIDRKNEYLLFVRAQEYQAIKSQLSDYKRLMLVLADIRWHSISEQLQFASIIKKEKLDLMHFPYFSIPILYNDPFVITIHDLILHHFATGQASTLPLPVYKAKRLAYLFAIKKAAKKAKKIIVPSLETKNEVINHLEVSGENIVVTHEGIDPSMEKAIRENGIDAPSYKKYFLTVGNAYPHKNLELLVDAFLEVRAKKSCTLLIVGKDDYFYKRLKKRVKEKGSNAIFFKHTVDDRELVSYYKHAIALITPSFMEGFGLPALEAMASGCMVIASDIPVFKEICKDAALYFNPYYKEQLVKKLQFVLSKPPAYFAKQKTIGLARAKKFSFHKMAKETLAVYNQSV